MLLSTKRILLLFMAMAMAAQASGSGIKISDVKLNTGRYLEFDLTWQHAWNNSATATPPENNDAAYITVYAKSRNSYTWERVKVKNNGGFYTEEYLPAAFREQGCVMLAKSPNQTGFKVSLYLESHFEPDMGYVYKVIAHEMVKVPSGPFWIGDGVSQERLGTGPAVAPLLLEEEPEELQVGKKAGMLYDTGKFAPGGTIHNFHFGYDEFYTMKCEISQTGFTEFLNSLTYSQQKAHVERALETLKPGDSWYPGGRQNRNGITVVMAADPVKMIPAVFGVDGNGNGIYNEEGDGGDRACNFLNFDDVTAYLYWAGMTLMTEFQFEKLCRGPEKPLAGEMAWGTNKAVDANTLARDGYPDEHATDKGDSDAGLCAHGYSGPQGPLRCGFAAANNTTRIGSGAGYYGAMELSGNLWEMCITLTGGLTSAPLGAPGKSLDENGLPPEREGNTFSATKGMGVRGGAWNSGITGAFNDMRISDRFYAGQDLTRRRNTFGGRGAVTIGQY